MAKKIDIELVEMVLKRTTLTELQQLQVLEDLKFESKLGVADDREPPEKKQFVIIVRDPYGKLGATGFEFSGWVVQIPEDDDPRVALEKLHCAAHDFNQTPKGRRMPIKTIAEACEFGSAKLFKERKIWVRTKEPVLVLPTNGRIADVEEL